MKKIKVINFSLIIFGFIFSNLLHASQETLNDDYGCRWSKTLNFKLKNINTGQNGNVFLINSKGKEVKETLFDIDEIHEDLKNTTQTLRNLNIIDPTHNVVVAGLSLIIQNADAFHAIYTPLKQAGTLVFLSGSSHSKYENIHHPKDKNIKYNFIDHYTYEPHELLTEFGERIKNSTLTFTGLKTIYNFYTEWEKSQKSILQEAKKVINHIVQNNNNHITLASFMKEIKSSLNKCQQESNENFWSSVHSEQFFLKFLKENLIKKTDLSLTAVSGVYIDLLTDYKNLQIKKIREIITKPLNDKVITLDDTLIENIKKSSDTAQKNIQDLNNITEILCILHLHSTNELCSCCSSSIALAQQGKEILDLQQMMKTHNTNYPNFLPFFVTLVSSSTLLTGDSTAQRATGVSQNYSLQDSDYENNKIKLDNIINLKVFPQTLLKENISQQTKKTKSNKRQKLDDDNDNKDDNIIIADTTD